jgi:hypothetical protein
MTDDGAAESATPFELLGHDDRIGIVEALVEHRREEPRDSALSFAELRERAGIRDSGRFNYHLDKLRGAFLQQTDEGYQLNHAGREVAGALLGGAFAERAERGPTELDSTCRACDATVSARYEDGVLSVVCEEGHPNHSDYFPPALVERFSLPKAVELSTLLGHQKFELMLREVCPECTGPLSASVVRRDGDPGFEGTCERCGFHFDGPPGLVVLTHPALRAFYLERDRDVRTGFLWSFPFLVDGDRYEIESDHPLEVRIDASMGDDELWFVVDEDCEVVEYGRGE